MGRHLLARSCTVALVFGLLALCAAQTPRPGPIDIPKTERENGLSKSSIKQIDDWLKYYTEIIRTTKAEKSGEGEKEDSVPAEKNILKARDDMVNRVYAWYDESLYRYEVARRAVVIVTPLLEGSSSGDPLHRVRRINAAIAISRMTQVSIQPALEKMVASANPAMRRIGWVGARDVPARGYRAIRTRILVQSTAATNTMFASLKKAAQTENNAHVVGAVFRMLDLPQSPGVQVPEKSMHQARVRAFDILKDVWPIRFRQVAGGDTDMSEACRNGVQAVSQLVESLGANDKKTRAAGLQMIVDAAWCAAIAYNKVMTPTEEAQRLIEEQRFLISKIESDNDADADSKIRAAEVKIEQAGVRIDELNPKVVVNSLLLRDCEAALNRLTGTEKDYLVMPLTAEKARPGEPLTPDKIRIRGPRGLAVLDALTKGWIGDLKKDGVVAPKFESPAEPTTAPATIPAN